MPRCPNGTRKNRKTRICEKKKTSTTKNRKLESLQKKYTNCLNKMNKSKSYKDYSGEKKFKKTMSQCRKIEDEIENLDTDLKLNEESVMEIIEPFSNLISDSKKKADIKRKLMNLTYDKKYMNCFTGKKTDNLYHMAASKLSCHLKYGDEI